MSNKKLTGEKTAEEIVNSNLNQIALIQYVQLYRFTIDEGVYLKLNCGIEEIVEPEVELNEVEKELPIVPCDFIMEKTKASRSNKELTTFLLEDETLLPDLGIKDRVIVQIELNELGEVAAAKVKRGIHPTLDSLALKKAYAMSAWQTGVDQLGRKRRCYIFLPFQFKVKETE
jgi:hypothetical protein